MARSERAGAGAGAGQIRVGTADPTDGAGAASRGADPGIASSRGAVTTVGARPAPQGAGPADAASASAAARGGGRSTTYGGRPRMSLEDRAKIFSPFDPLDGFREALRAKEREVEQAANDGAPDPQPNEEAPVVAIPSIPRPLP